jgi:uncharacterized coiled-coil protein SlyX
VTYQLEDDVEYEPEEAPRRGRRWVSVIVFLALAATGIASALVWRAYGNNMPTFSSLSSSSAEGRDKVISLKDFQVFQQQINAQIQATTQLLGSQQAEIKHLSEQMTVLGAKLDALQQSVASAQVAPPAPVASKAPPVPMPRVRKKPAVPKPTEESPAEQPSPLPSSRPPGPN